MPSTLDPELLQNVMRLPENQRSELAARLLESLEEDDAPSTPEEVRSAWIAELDRRARESDSGAVGGIPYEQAWREISGADG
jgi:putative addiction module component (TIGR02574 family)